MRLLVEKIREIFAKNNYNMAQTIAYMLVLITFIGSITFVIYNLIVAPTTVAIKGEMPKSHYVLMLLQCVVGIIVLFLPSLIERKFKFEIPSFMTIVFFVFLYGAIYLGEVRSFYYRFENWDMILHTFSGLMIGAVGFSVVHILNAKEKITLNPLFVALFAFCFALAIDVIWEIYEFLADGLLGTNMQKFSGQSGDIYIGRDAIKDTMEDLIVDGIGAFVMAFIGYISLKMKNGFIEKLLIRRKKK